MTKPTKTVENGQMPFSVRCLMRKLEAMFGPELVRSHRGILRPIRWKLPTCQSMGVYGENSRNPETWDDRLDQSKQTFRAQIQLECGYRFDLTVRPQMVLKNGRKALDFGIVYITASMRFSNNDEVQKFVRAVEWAWKHKIEWHISMMDHEQGRTAPDPMTVEFSLSHTDLENALKRPWK